MHQSKVLVGVFAMLVSTGLALPAGKQYLHVTSDVLDKREAAK
ncbi:hypothetical protein PENVUL_c026G01147, partial [Penicillium vulpinum]